MIVGKLATIDLIVALLAEGVDRNVIATLNIRNSMGSPSSRRAWIEITFRIARVELIFQVALLAEGVDRNH